MKERLRQIVTMLALVSGVGELAASQIHILASTKLFAGESGFYLFLFIIFGLTTGLNAYLLKDIRGIVVLVGCGILAIWSGIVYRQMVTTDVIEQVNQAIAKGVDPGVTMADVNSSLTLVLISIVIYAIGIVLIPILSWGMPDKSTVA